MSTRGSLSNNLKTLPAAAVALLASGPKADTSPASIALNTTAPNTLQTENAQL